MKVYLKPSTESRAIKRVETALIKYAPKEVEIVTDPGQADLAVLHIWGRHDTTQKQIDWLTQRGKKYAMIQYCLRSTLRPDTKDWVQMWNGAKLVWSYYDLPALMREDMDLWLTSIKAFNFYYAPLGVDSDVFKERPERMGRCRLCKGDLDGHPSDHKFIGARKYKILTCSPHALVEGVKESVLATKRVNGEMVHLGEELRRGLDIVCVTNVGDEDLSYLYSQAEYVSGLRRVEGFELPAAEGLLCGARPILFDRPHYRQWFEGLAKFIPETPREQVVDNLEILFKEGATPVTDTEKAIAKKLFNWQTIIDGFWKRII